MAGGVCMAGGVHGRGCAWQGVCMGGMHGRGGVCGRVGAYMKGACMTGVCVWGGAGETATAVGGTHPTGMHSCGTMSLASLLKTWTMWFI